MDLNNFFYLKDMKWGNVFHYYLCCHIYYCILYNEKANEKPQKNRTEPWQHYQRVCGSREANRPLSHQPVPPVAKLGMPFQTQL